MSRQHAGPIVFLALALFLTGHLSGIVLWSTLFGGVGAETEPTAVLPFLTVLLILLAITALLLALVALHLRRVTAERTRLYEAEREARATAEAAIRTRDEFLSFAAHELRNPLTSLYGFSEYLNQARARGSIESDRLQRGLTVINRQANKLARLIDELLEVSRIEMNRLTLQCEPADLVEVVEHAVETTRAHYPDRAINFSGGPLTPALVDVQRMRQVIANLLDNALKFSPEHSPIEVEIQTLSDGRIEVAVRDHGGGVAAAQRERIFERFFRAEGITHNPGLGVGLYVSRAVLEMHGGELVAEFPDDGGSRFVLRVPESAELPIQTRPLNKAG